MTRTLRNLFILLILAVLALGSAACAGTESKADDGRTEATKDDPADAAKPQEEPAVPVEVVALGRGPIEAVLRYSTNLEAEDSVGVFSQAARQVRSLSVEEGDKVRRGQVLLQLQDDEQRTRVAKVKSQLERANREYERQKRLYADDLISEQSFNDATYDLNQLQLELEDAERELSYTDVKAPISGTITRRYVNVGDNVTINQHLFDIVDFDSIVARVYVPEKELARLERGVPARITSPALGADRLFHGSIDRLSPVVDPASGTIKVTVAIPQQEGLRPGMYVDVQLITDVHDDALLVPKRAVVYDDDQLFVYRMDPEAKTVERVYLQPRLEDEEWIEPKDSLAAGDQVVVAGQAGLKDGAKVRLAGEKPEAEATEAVADAGGADAGKAGDGNAGDDKAGDDDKGADEEAAE